MDDELRMDKVMFDGGEPGAEYNQGTAKWAAVKQNMVILDTGA